MVSGSLPISAALPGVSKTDVYNFATFASDLQDTYTPQFTFIEPHYGNTGDATYMGGSSQHPTDTMAAGEALLAATYQAIRSSPVWSTSVLIVTYDEHGGYYDHVAPPPTVNPGDFAVGKGANQHSFDFTRLGVRVPAVVVSPLIPPRTVVSTTFDHTSIIKTVLKLFVGDDAHLTERDKAANDLTGLLAGPRSRRATSRHRSHGAAVAPAAASLDRSAPGLGQHHRIPRACLRGGHRADRRKRTRPLLQRHSG